MKKFFFIFLPFIIFGSLDDSLKKIENHFLLEDYEGALKEIKEAKKNYPNEKKITKVAIRALSEMGDEEGALLALKGFTVDELKEDLSVLEDLAWGILKKGTLSSQYSTKLSSLIGVYFTRDARAVFVIRSMLRDSNAILRAVALQLSCSYKDELLIREVEGLFENEKDYFVRLEVLKAIGHLGLKNKERELKEILKNDKASFEERALSTEALISIYDKIDVDELNILLKSPYSGFRILGAELAAHFKIKEAGPEIKRLAFDARYDVRMAALNSIALFYKDIFSKEELKSLLDKTYKDTNPFVAITAAYVGLPFDKEAKIFLKKWLSDPYAENRRFAAGAIAHAGAYGKELSRYALNKSKDDFVRANVAIGLIGQREELKKCSNVIYDFVKNKKLMWMWEENGIFQVLAPSALKHIEQLPNYPEAIDQVVSLNLLSLLAMLDDPRAQDAIKSFLTKKSWGITGLAAITLLQEGDEDSLSLLRTLLKDKDKNVRIQAALALAIIGKDKSGLPILESAYFESPHEMKLSIIEAIGRIGGKESFPFLLKVLEEPFQILRVAAASAIIQTANL